MSRIAVLVLAVMLAGSPAWAGPAEDCMQDKDPDAKIAGCTQFIAGASVPKALAVAHYQRGRGHALKKQYDEAMTDYGEAIRHNPDFMDAYYGRAILYEIRKQVDNAVADFDRVIALLNAILATKPTDALRQSIKKIRDRRDGIRSDQQMHARWREYLEEIQARDDYPNWSGPPHDLYLERQQQKQQQETSGAPRP
jgi:tetratricopeptide (TPR) repeat protein